MGEYIKSGLQAFCNFKTVGEGDSLRINRSVVFVVLHLLKQVRSKTYVTYNVKISIYPIKYVGHAVPLR